jgi:hypothetical protein
MGAKAPGRNGQIAFTGYDPAGEQHIVIANPDSTGPAEEWAERALSVGGEGRRDDRFFIDGGRRRCSEGGHHMAGDYSAVSLLLAVQRAA